MKAPNFLSRRIQTELAFRGVEYTFSRYGEDKFHQPTGKVELTIVLKGLYHETNSYMQTINGESSVTRTKKSPMILCMYEDGSQLEQGDIVVVDNKQYKVSGVLNIQDYSIAADISLEEVV